MAEKIRNWDDDRPIYRQLTEELIAGILKRTYPEGEMLPSVRALADTYLVNPLTVARAYRELDEFTETRRGIGLIVKEGVRELLLKRERRKFLADEWPGIRERIESLEIDVEDLLAPTRKSKSSKAVSHDTSAAHAERTRVRLPAERGHE